MGQGKRAWIYCAIDAPEDRNGALKSQFKQLIDYGEQIMKMEPGLRMQNTERQKSAMPPLKFCSFI